MKKATGTLFPFVLILGIAIVISGLVYLNYRNMSDSQTITDFVNGWAGTRWFIYNGWSPYDNQTTSEIEKLVYGSPNTVGQPKGFFLFPFYSIFVFGLFALIRDLQIATAIWLTFSEILLLSTLILSVRLIEWRPKKWLWPFLIVFGFGWYHSIRQIINLDYSVVGVFLLTLSLNLIRKKNDGLAGLVLVFAGLELIPLFIPWLLISLWAISQKRWVLFWSPLISFGLLSASVAIFLPDWFIQFFQQNIFYYLTTPNNTPGSIMAFWMPGVGRQLGWVVTVFTISVLVVETRVMLRKDFRWLLWVVLLSTSLLPIAGIRVHSDNYIYMLPSVTLILSVWDQRWGKLGKWLIGGFLAVLLIGLWVMVLNSTRHAITPDFDPIILFWSPVVVVVGLYWVRWWAVHSPKLPLEILAERIGR